MQVQMVEEYSCENITEAVFTLKKLIYASKSIVHFQIIPAEYGYYMVVLYTDRG